MNGIDLLFIIIGLVLLFMIWHETERFLDWSKWDRDRRRQRKLARLELEDELSEIRYRRRQRKLARLELEDELSEIRYRQYLRLIFKTRSIADEWLR